MHLAIEEGMYPETAPFYDLFGGSAAETQNRAEFVASFLKNKSSLIVDVGAGTGQMAFELADEGYNVACFEPSVSMHALLLDRLRTRKDLHNQVSAFPCHLENVEYHLNADAVCAFSVFSHVSREKRLSMLKGAHYHLKLGGLLVFNCVQFVSARQDQPLALMNEKKIGKVTYRHFASSSGISKDQRLVTFKFEVEHGSQMIRKYEEEFTLSLDTKEQIENLLTEAGFQLATCYSTTQKDPYSVDAPGFIVVASRA